MPIIGRPLALTISRFCELQKTTNHLASHIKQALPESYALHSKMLNTVSTLILYLMLMKASQQYLPLLLTMHTVGCQVDAQIFSLIDSCLFQEVSHHSGAERRDSHWYTRRFQHLIIAYSYVAAIYFSSHFYFIYYIFIMLKESLSAKPSYLVLVE